MKTNQSKINMETANLSPTEWLEKFIIISKEELELSRKFPDDEVFVSIVSDNDNDNDDDDDDDDDDGDDDDDDDHDGHEDDYCHHHSKDFDDDDDSDSDYVEYTDDDDDDNKNGYSKIRKAQYDLRMIRMAPLFASQPRLEKICKNWKNEFIPSSFTTYTFKRYKNDSVNELHKRASDLEYLINLCGRTLTCLDVTQYPISQIIPIINANCPNLEELLSGFKESMSQDFENCFSNMSHLRLLTIKWQCKNSTLPMTLAKSLVQIAGTLKIFHLSSTLKGNDVFSPDSLASVFPQLIALKYLTICGFGLSQLLLQSIGEMKNLVDLILMASWPKNHPILDTRINMHPIGYLKNLEKLFILYGYGIRDEFLINLCNNAKKLRVLHIIGINITDNGMSAIDNLEQLEWFDLKLTCDGKKNEFITDESIQCLFNPKLQSLNISNCIKVTDKSVMKLPENLPNLRSLYIQMTKVTREAVRKIDQLTKHREVPLSVHIRKY